MTALKRYFITGLLILVPLGITFWVLTALLAFMDQTLLLLPASWRPDAWLGVHVPGLGADPHRRWSSSSPACSPPT